MPQLFPDYFLFFFLSDLSDYNGFETITYEDLQLIGQKMRCDNLKLEESLTPNVDQRLLLGIILYTSGSTGVPKGKKNSTTRNGCLTLIAN